jgi:hypothetical protein
MPIYNFLTCPFVVGRSALALTHDDLRMTTKSLHRSGVAWICGNHRTIFDDELRSFVSDAM